MTPPVGGFGGNAPEAKNGLFWSMVLDHSFGPRFCRPMFFRPMVLDIVITYIYCIMAWNVLYRKIICDRERD